MKPADYTSLEDLLSSGVAMTTDEILAISVSVLRCLYLLHKFEYVHGDLESKWIYVDHGVTGKVYT